MASGRVFRWGSAIAFLLGLALATGLIAWQGFASVGRAVWDVGWGLVLVSALRALPVLADALGWRVVLGPDWRGGTGRIILFHWIRDSINTLLPVAQVGGDVVGGRLLTFHGVTPGVAGAGLLVDKTLEVFAQALFVLIGVGLLLVRDGSDDVFAEAIAGLVVTFVVAGAFLAAQWFGMGRLIEAAASRLGRFLGHGGDGLAGLDTALRDYYRAHGRLALATLLHLGGWLAGALDIWLVMWFLGAPISLADAVVLESVSQIIRSAAFAVPATVGVQEAGYMIVGALVGISPEHGLVVSLVKRLRHVVTGVPALIYWQGMEGRRWFLRARRNEGESR